LIIAGGISFALASFNNYSILDFLKLVSLSKTTVFVIFFIILLYTIKIKNNNINNINKKS
jgi:hypothetical protein